MDTPVMDSVDPDAREHFGSILNGYTDCGGGGGVEVPADLLRAERGRISDLRATIRACLLRGALPVGVGIHPVLDPRACPVCIVLRARTRA